MEASFNDLATLPESEWNDYMLDHGLVADRLEAGLIHRVLATGEGDVIIRPRPPPEDRESESRAGATAAFDKNQPRDREGKWRKTPGGGGWRGGKLLWLDVEAEEVPGKSRASAVVFENTDDQATIRERFAAMGDDEWLWVFHSTHNETADDMLRNGIDPEGKPRNLARERYEQGEEAFFQPGAGLSPGLTIAPRVSDTGGYGNRQLAVRIQKRDVQVSPEQAALGATEPIEALSVGDAQTKKVIPTVDIREVTEPGKDPSVIDDVVARLELDDDLGTTRVSGEDFHKAIAPVLAGEFGGFLTNYSAEDYAQMETFMSADGKVGGAIKTADDGVKELVSLFNNGGPPGAGSQMAKQLVERGATRLDNLGDDLRRTYERLGFEVTETIPWNDDYAPVNWNYERFHRPNVYVMELKK